MNLQDFQNSVNTFSVSQMFSNSDGKTSASAVAGIVVTFAGTVAFLYGCIDRSYISKTSDILMYSGGVLTLGTGMLTARKLKKGKSLSEEATIVAKLPDQDEPKPI